jgi:hypothetical protein
MRRYVEWKGSDAGKAADRIAAEQASFAASAVSDASKIK